MSTTLLMCFALTLHTISGVWTEGKHFVASCPWLRKNAVCTAHITNSENLAKVDISDVRDNKIVDTRTFLVEPRIPVRYLVTKYDNNANAHNKQVANKNPVVKVFKSRESICVTVITHLQQDVFVKADAILLTPEASCHTSYYTVTANANPFFAIFSFDFTITNVTVKFPLFKNSFSVNCFESDKCSPGKTVILNLLNYDLWYFTLDDKEANLLNVHITSDHPVYVVSGNRYGWSGRDDVSWDICTTSLKPSTTWGKKYIVANVVSGSASFAISTINTPSTVTFHEGYMKTEYTVTSTHPELLDYDPSENTLAVTSDDPFGLYQVFHSRSLGDHDLGDVSILNLIPVEQWKRSSFYVDIALPDNFQTKLYLITQSPRNAVVFPSFVKNDDSFKWHSSVIFVKGRAFSVAEFTPKDLNAKFFLNSPIGRMMLYVTMLPTEIGSSFFAAYPYDFYQGEIYQKSCKISGIICLRDGIDNDCDGYVDEETKNGMDDDGDGLVDEDNVEPYCDGQWSPWTYACDQPCNDVKLTVKVRSCLNKSADGNVCPGVGIKCDEKPCPTDCKRSGSSSSGCFCNAACMSCEDNLFKCDGPCKSGYRKTTNCMKRYSTGSNIDDACAIEGGDGFDAIESSDAADANNLTFTINWIVATPGFVALSICLGFVVVYMIYQEKMTTNANNDYGIDPELQADRKQSDDWSWGDLSFSN